MPEPLASLLQQLATERPTGYLFRRRNGKPYAYRNLAKMLRGSMVGRAGGLRMFRSFRAEVLRENDVPRELERYWMGHAGHREGEGEFTLPSTVTDLYAAGTKNDVAWRRQWAEKWGRDSPWFPRNNPGNSVQLWQRKNCQLDYMDDKTDQVVGLWNP